jgi:hypothetical protein
VEQQQEQHMDVLNEHEGILELVVVVKQLEVHEHGRLLVQQLEQLELQELDEYEHQKLVVEEHLRWLW